MIKSFIFFLGLIMTFSLYAQEPSKAWLIKNNRGNRYEGSLGRSVSGSGIRLVSLTAHKELYEFKKKQKLQVDYYSPESNTLRIRAEELDGTDFYLMLGKKKETVKGWQKFANWPVDEVLGKLSVITDNLGVLVGYGKTKSREFLPAWVFHRNKPQSVNNYSAVFQLARSVSSGNYKIHKGKTRNNADPLGKFRISKKDGGNPFSLLIPLKLLKSEGWYRMEVTLYEKGTLDPFSYSFAFYHKPQ